MIITVTFVFLCASILQCHSFEAPDYEALKNQLVIYLTNGIITPEFHDAISAPEFRAIFYGEFVDPDLYCTSCEIIFEALLEARRNGTTEETVVNYLIEACNVLKVASPHMCESMFNDRKGMVYVIDKPDLNVKYVCSMLIQGFCKPPFKPNWTVEIHEGKSVEKLKGSGIAQKFIHLTDIHYDPLYEPGSNINCADNVCCQVDTEPPSNPEDVSGYWGEYINCDTPMHTLVDALQHISKNHPDVQYIYYTGDIVSRREWSTSKEGNTQAVVDVFDAFKSHLKNITIFPILGNHEPHPTNLWVTDPNISISTNWLFEETAKQWLRYLPESTRETIIKGGYYTVLVSPGLRVVAINSNVAYVMNWWLLYDEIDPYGQLEWLENVLHEAEKSNEIVHILSHVSTGDSSIYSHWSAILNKIVQRYTNTIAGIFNGHTHCDEFSLYHDTNDKPINVAWNGGSFATYNGNNPNYKILHVDDKNFDILEVEEWTFNLRAANKNSDGSINWFKMYSFKEAYNLDGVTPNDLAELTVRMAKEDGKKLLQQFYRFQFRNGPASEKECDEKCLKALLCRTVTSVFGEDSHCERLMSQWT